MLQFATTYDYFFPKDFYVLYFIVSFDFTFYVLDAIDFTCAV